MENTLTFHVGTNIILIIFAKLKEKIQISCIYNNRNEAVL